MIKNNQLIVLIGIVLVIGCSSKKAIVDINNPSIKFFKKSIKQLRQSNKRLGGNIDNKFNEEIEEEIYFFDRNIEVRNKIIDSLSLLDKKKIILIDSRTDNNGERIESSYFFYEDKTIFAGFIRRDSVIKEEVFVKYVPEIKEITKQYLEKNLYDVNYIHEIFNSNKIPAKLDWGNEYTSYLVTVVRDGKVSYYSVSGFVNYKVIKLSENL